MKRRTIQLSQRKRAALHTFFGIGLKPSDGYDYQLDELILPRVTLDQVRRELSVIKSSLSEELVKARERDAS
jgi:hypothetical protein